MGLDEVKTYLRIDADMADDDALIQSLIDSAEELICQETGKTKIKNGTEYADINTSKLYNLAIKIMVSHWYENRGIQVPGSLASITYSAEMIISHIALSGDFI